MAEPRAAGLDPAHILAVCEHVADHGGYPPTGYVTATPDGVSVQVTSVRAARHMRAALAQLGYTTELSRPGRRWQLAVTGWDSDALDARLAAIRSVLAQLTTQPTATAAAAITRYRQLATRCPAARLGLAALIQTGDDLRATVAARCGICLWRDPAILPADIGDALRLRAIWLLEHAIAESIDRQLRTARRALVLYRSHREHTTADWARDIALAQAASPVLRERGPAAAYRTAAAAPPLWPSHPAGPPTPPRPATRPGPEPAQQATPGFPTGIAAVTTEVAGQIPGTAGQPGRSVAPAPPATARRRRHSPQKGNPRNGR